jgi:hypothetical protein
MLSNVSLLECYIRYTEDSGELDDLSNGRDHPIFNEILVSDDCLRHAFREVLRSAILSDDSMGEEAAVILETHLCGSQILWCGPDIVKQACKVIHLSSTTEWNVEYLGSVFPIGEVIANNCLS